MPNTDLFFDATQTSNALDEAAENIKKASDNLACIHTFGFMNQNGVKKKYPKPDKLVTSNSHSLVLK